MAGSARGESISVVTPYRTDGTCRPGVDERCQVHLRDYEERGQIQRAGGRSPLSVGGGICSQSESISTLRYARTLIPYRSTSRMVKYRQAIRQREFPA